MSLLMAQSLLINFFQIVCNKTSDLVTNEVKGGTDVESMTPSEAAAMLMEQYGDEIYRFVRFTVGNKSDADDMVQEVFVRVIQNWNRFNHRSSSKTWLWAIAKNCIREYFRTQKRSPQQVQFDETLPDEHSRDFASEIVLEEGLEQLTATQREVFVERIVHRQSTKDTATLFGWSESKVRTTLHRAISAMRQSFQKGEDVQ